jgi:hypothetical protein
MSRQNYQVLVGDRSENKYTVTVTVTVTVSTYCSNGKSHCGEPNQQSMLCHARDTRVQVGLQDTRLK